MTPLLEGVVGTAIALGVAYGVVGVAVAVVAAATRSLFLAVGAVAALGLASLSPVAKAEDPIRIGSFLSVTGPAAFLGDPELKTLELYVHQLNENGGLLGRERGHGGRGRLRAERGAARVRRVHRDLGRLRGARAAGARVPPPLLAADLAVVPPRPLLDPDFPVARLAHRPVGPALLTVHKKSCLLAKLLVALSTMFLVVRMIGCSAIL